MKPTLELLAVQAHILRTLLFIPEASFSNLQPQGITSDHFTFHLKSLVEAGLLERVGDKYSLTARGKEFANQLDTDTKTIERQAKLSVLLVPVRQRQGKTEYLVQQRLKQPFYGYIGFASGKIGWGESVLSAAARELREETGLTATELRLCGVKHKTDVQANDGALLEDKYFFTVRCEISDETGFTPQFEGGSNHWHTREEIAKLTPLFDGVDGSVAMAENPQLTFVEATYQVEGY